MESTPGNKQKMGPFQHLPQGLPVQIGPSSITIKPIGGCEFTSQAQGFPRAGGKEPLGQDKVCGAHMKGVRLRPDRPIGGIMRI
jgi:hypothetical protein